MVETSSATAIQVREAGLREQPQVRSLIEAAGLVDGKEEGYLDGILPNRRVLVAEAEGEIRAVVVLQNTVEERGAINYLVVDPAHGGQGIGSRLLTEAEAKLKADGVKKASIILKTIAVDTPDPAISDFYENRGWQRAWGFNGTLIEKIF